jgi:C4-dicarboxylate-specific signal transduction histidine kinase
VAGVAEKVKTADLVEEALGLNLDAFRRHDIAVARDYTEPDLEITVDRHKVLQILVNLLGNAKRACSDSARADKQMTVHVGSTDRCVQIAVSDNGVGIPPENLTRIFQHGFTTRKDGHGFGLHSSALAAKELGGSLKVHSAGAGAGAKFTLELPVAQSGAHER